MSDEQYIADRMEKCRHFTGTRNQKCEAGISYESVTVRHDPMPYVSREGWKYTTTTSMPCLGGSHNPAGATCGSCSRYTREEATAHRAEIEERFSREGVARKAIVAAIDAGNGTSGYIACPACGNRLGYSRAASNGHIRAACDTPGCTSWME